MRVIRSLADRTLEKIEFPAEPNGCWLWTAGTAGRDRKNGNGYGRIYSGQRNQKGNPLGLQAHRVVYELANGPIPEGLEIDHLCRNPRCVNPDHLEPVTYEENQRRGNSPMAKQARQTHCKRGHPLDAQNTYHWKGTRRCRKCNADQQAAIRERRRAGV